MANKTAIEWTDRTWNPVTGCTKVSAGCKNCYAERLFHWPYPGRDFTDVRCHPERLDQPLHWRNPCRIFVNSMSDLFHEAIPESFIDQIILMMMLARRHTYQILTKRPRRMLGYFTSSATQDRICKFWLDTVREIPGTKFEASHHHDSLLGIRIPNLWLGVSIEDQKTADERIPLLLQAPAAVRWVSYEPALGPVDLSEYLTVAPYDCPSAFDHNNCGLDWVVAGGESGPHARPSHPDWFRAVRDQCQSVGVPFFFKQWGEWACYRQGWVELLPMKTELHFWEIPWISARIGKKPSGRLLDGREWNEFPAGTMKTE